MRSTLGNEEKSAKDSRTFVTATSFVDAVAALVFKF
jgi:hypothetical protein